VRTGGKRGPRHSLKLKEDTEQLATVGVALEGIFLLRFINGLSRFLQPGGRTTSLVVIVVSYTLRQKPFQ